MTYVRCLTCGNTAVREPKVSEFITRHVLERRHAVIVQETDEWGNDVWEYDENGRYRPNFGPAKKTVPVENPAFRWALHLKPR